MAIEETDDGCRRLWGLSEFHSAIVYIVLAAFMVAYVGYQLITGRVFTKSGELPIQQGLGFLAIELVAAGVGGYRGVKMIGR
jgi:hypothetical protein